MSTFGFLNNRFLKWRVRFGLQQTIAIRHRNVNYPSHIKNEAQRSSGGWSPSVPSSALWLQTIALACLSGLPWPTSAATLLNPDQNPDQDGRGSSRCRHYAELGERAYRARHQLKQSPNGRDLPPSGHAAQGSASLQIQIPSRNLHPHRLRASGRRPRAAAGDGHRPCWGHRPFCQEKRH